MVLIVVVAVVAGAVYATVRGYQSASQATNKDYTSGLTPQLRHASDYFFVVVADIESVSADAHTATVRLNFTETSTKYIDDAGVEVRKPLTVSLYGTVADPTSGSLNTFELAKGVVPFVDTTMALPEGESSRYPFDTYDGQLLAIVKTSSGATVPSLVVASNAADGWTTSKSLLQQGDSFGLSLHIGRASDAQFYAIFIMVLMWALAVAGVIMALILVRDPKREIGADLLVYLAALLFALPLIRTLLPGNPGLGVLADFAVYFWVEAVVGVTLVVLLFVWIRRNQPPHEHHPAQGIA